MKNLPMMPAAELMARDVGNERLSSDVVSFFGAIHAPGAGRVTDAADLTVAADAVTAAFTGTIYQDLASEPTTRICILRLDTGELQIRGGTEGSDRLPRWSLDGTLAFLSDRRRRGHFQLYLAEARGTSRAAPAVDGVIEYLQWSPDGRRILLGVAGFGADLAGAQGGTTTAHQDSPLPAWAPIVETADAENRWRKLYCYDVANGTMRQVSPSGINPWEAAWLGDGRIVCVASVSHSEGSWYESQLIAVDFWSGASRTLYKPRDQIGLPTAPASGRHLAFVEAVCSDRLLVAGTLRLLDASTGAMREIDTRQVDVTHMLWRDERHLTYVGQRGLETVVGEYALDSDRSEEIWASMDRTFAGWCPAIWPLPHGGCVAVGEAFAVAPEIAVIRKDSYQSVCSLATAATRAPDFNRASIEPYTWSARDGLEMQGWLVRPERTGHVPLVMDIHGGPVWSQRNRWQGRLRGAKVLADRGCAVFFPNPRGSSGRGLEFARLVKGDLGGEDAYDCLRGIDALVEQGIADPARLGVTGISYGGFMAAWLITQDPRFAAAAPISPICNWYSQHRTSQIGFFDTAFLQESACVPGGRFFARSPVMFAHRARTPTLLLAGGRDQNTPASQALEFHRSLLEHGVHSVLATYPSAGHGVRSYPEVIDATTRYVGWMLHHLLGGLLLR